MRFKLPFIANPEVTCLGKSLADQWHLYPLSAVISVLFLHQDFQVEPFLYKTIEKWFLYNEHSSSV